MSNMSPTAKLIKKTKKSVTTAKQDVINDALSAGSSVKSVEKTATKTNTKASVVKKTKVKIPESDLIVTTSAMIESLTASEALSLAKKLMDDTDFNNFKLGGVLSMIQANVYWEELGYPSFKNFMEEEFAIPYRKGMYLIQIYNSLVESGVSWAKVKDLGWTKLKELAPILTTDNVDSWVEKAKDLTVIQLQALIKAQECGDLDEGEVEQTKVTEVSTLTFKVHEDQKEIVKACIEQAKVAYKTEYDAVALENICTDYLASLTGKPSVQKVSLKDLLNEFDPKEIIEEVYNLYPEVKKMVASTAAPTKPTKDTLKETFLEIGLDEILSVLEEAYPDAELTVVVD